MVSEIAHKLREGSDSDHEKSFGCRGDEVVEDNDQVPLGPNAHGESQLGRWPTRLEDGQLSLNEPAASKTSLSTKVVEHDVYRMSHNVDLRRPSHSDDEDEEVFTLWPSLN